YAAKGSDGIFRSATKLETINTDLHEAAAVFDAQLNQLIFTRNNYYKGRQTTANDKSVKLEMFVAQLADGAFKKEKPFVIGSREYSVGQPCISSDGSVLIFVSDMPGGFGGTDLYFSQRIAGVWTEPVNLGPVINTKGNEMFPFLSATGELFFASNWHPGLGGYDIFISQRADGAWTKPLNPGSPLNSSRDDLSLIIQDGLGYLSSNRPGGKGSDDIYACTRLQEIQSLLVRNSKMQNVIGAKVTLYAGDRIEQTGYTDINGILSITVNPDKVYTVTVEKEGYIESHLMHVEQYRSNNGLLPVLLQELYEVNEVPDLHQEVITAETPSEVMEFLEMETPEIPAEAIAIPAAVESDIHIDYMEEEWGITTPVTNVQTAAETVPELSVATPEEEGETSATAVAAILPETAEQKLPAETIVEEINNKSATEAVAADVVTYEVQLGVFRNPDYTKTEAFKKYGEVQSVKKDDGTFKVSISNILSKADADTVRVQALGNGFTGAYIITYKNGVRIN
ncbi:MAG: hypothetical protein ACK4IY_05375, partial [Chitinophagales bacterium]